MDYLNFKKKKLIKINRSKKDYGNHYIFSSSMSDSFCFG